MLVFLGFSIIAAILITLASPTSYAPDLMGLHDFCLKACPTSKHRELYQALVCAGKIQSLQIRSSFAQLGLIHLLIVSGSHFIVVEKMLRYSLLKLLPEKWRAAFLFGSLILFALMTLGTPPVLRALISLCLRHLTSVGGFNWSRLQILTISGFLTLPFCQTPWALCSLFLSWLAALALLDFSETEREQSASIPKTFFNSLFINTKVYVLLAIPLLLLSVPSPLSILANVLFAPVMNLVLFPISIAAFLIPGAVRVTDAVWSAFLWVVELCAPLTPPIAEAKKFPSEFLVFYLSALTIAVTIYKRKIKLSRLAAGFGLPLLLFSTPASASFSDASPASAALPKELIVWNVGQGSWATLKSRDACIHFDLGGEQAPWNLIKENCLRKRNAVVFSHWDSDHVLFTRRAAKSLPNLCVLKRPFGKSPDMLRDKILDNVRDCTSTDSSPTPIIEVFSKAAEMKSSNGKSRVFFASGVLIPGDSGQREESMWLRKASTLNIRFLLAGHHGSKTATSKALLGRLRNLKLIVASARRAKYGHPSEETLKRAKKSRVSLVSTEDWGHIRIEVSRESETPRLGPASLAFQKRPAH